jgi:hypothetical protein
MLPPPAPPVPELEVVVVPPVPEELVDEAPAPPTPPPGSMTALPPHAAAITKAVEVNKVVRGRWLCMGYLDSGKALLVGGQVAGAMPCQPSILARGAPDRCCPAV